MVFVPIAIGTSPRGGAKCESKYFLLQEVLKFKFPPSRSWLEHLTVNQRVLGSSPRGGADNLNQRVFVPIAIGTSPRGGANNLNQRVFVPIADRKSTRLYSSHVRISYAVFRLKNKKDFNI